MSFFRKKNNPDPSFFLAAIPVRNPLVKERTQDSGLRLTGPLRHGKFSRFLGIASTEKSFDLDELGAEVWQACDGQANIESIIVAFSDKHRVNIREAEVAVKTFLNTLIQRNLIVLVASGKENAETR